MNNLNECYVFNLGWFMHRIKSLYAHEFFVKFHENYATMAVIPSNGESVMPISIKATTNTRTGIRGVQLYGDMYRWRVNAARFRSLTGQDPTPSFIARLNERKSGCVDYASFYTIEDAGDDLCQFLKAMIGVSFEY